MKIYKLKETFILSNQEKYLRASRSYNTCYYYPTINARFHFDVKSVFNKKNQVVRYFRG